MTDDLKGILHDALAIIEPIAEIKVCDISGVEFSHKDADAARDLVARIREVLSN